MALGVCGFGWGEASLPRRAHLRPQLLRLDTGVVQALPGDTSAGAVVEAVVGIARPLGVRGLADGVQTPRQRDRLAAAGVADAQRPLLAPPSPPANPPRRNSSFITPAA